MLNYTSHRVQALFLIVTMAFQTLALPGRGGAHTKAPDSEVKTSPSAPATGRQKRSIKIAQPQKTPVPNSTLAAAITANNRDSFPNHGDGKAHQGDTITYSVAVTNTGDANATSVNYADTIDQNTSTLVGGSPTIQFTATADAYSAIGNVKIDTSTITPGSGKTVLENDAPGAATLSGFGSTLANANAIVPNGSNTVTTANGGTVTMNADGSFKYNPAAGFGGTGVTDTFWYRLTNNTIGTGNPTGFPSGAARVTINVSTPIWFVNQAAAGGGNGTLTTPFNCLTGAGCFSAVNDGGAGHPKAGDLIFLYKNPTPPAVFTGGLTLLNNQKVIGEGATASLATIAGVTVPPGSDPLPPTGNAPPVITTIAAATNGVNIGVGLSNTLRGFTIGNTTGFKIASGANFGTLTTSEITLNGTGGALNLNSGALAATFMSITSSSSGTQGITLSGATGSLTSTGGTTISGNTTQCILIGTSTADLSFGNTSCTGGTDGLSFQNNANAGHVITFGTLNVSGGSGNAFLHGAGGGNVTVTGAATLSSAGDAISVSSPTATNVINFQAATSATRTASGGNGVNWVGTTGATIQLSALTIQTSGGIGLNATTGGTITITNGTGTINNTTQAASAIVAANVTLNANFLAIKSSGGTNAVQLSNVSGTSNFGGGALSGSGSDVFQIINGNGSVTYSGTITNSNGGKAALVQSKTGGTVTFSGQITDTTGQGVAMISNSGGVTVNFAGGLSLSTGGSDAFTATGGGIVNVSGTNNIITTSGKAINWSTDTSVTGVTFNNVTSSTGAAVTIASSGASNFTFNDVTSTTGAAVTVTGGTGAMTFHAINVNGAAKGVSLSGGYAGAFSVTGTSATVGSGGTIQLTTTRGIEVIGPGSGGQPSVSLKNMNFTNNAQSVQDTAATCANIGGGTNLNCSAAIHVVNITGFTLDNVDVNGSNQVGVNGNNVTTLTMINGSKVRNCGNEPNENGMQFANLLGTSTITGATFSANYNSGLDVVNTVSTAGTLTVTNGTFTGNGIGTHGSALIKYSGDGTANMTVSVQTSSFNFNSSYGYFSDTASTAHVTSTVNGSTFGTVNAVPVAIGYGTSGSSQIDFTVTGNTIVGGDALQGSIFMVGFSETGITTASSYLNGTFDSNSIGTTGVVGSGCKNNCGGVGIFPAGAGGMNLTITNNQIRQVSSQAISLSSNAGTSGTLTMKIKGNTLAEPQTGFSSFLRALVLTPGNSAVSPTTNPTSCFDIGGAGANKNTVSGSWLAGSYFRIQNANNTGTTRFPGYGGSATDSAALSAFVEGNNTGVTGNTAISPGTGISGGAACPLLLALGGISAQEIFPLLAGFYPVTLSAMGPVRTVIDPPRTRVQSASNDSRSKVSSMSGTGASLNQQQLDSIVSASVQRWAATGLTRQQVAALRAIKFEIADLQSAYLGEADGNRILVDRNAQGRGWFVDANPTSDFYFAQAVSATRLYTDSLSASAGHIDLLTAIEHEIGHRLGLPDTYAAKDCDSIMYGYLTVGERRLPAQGQARFAQANNMNGVYFLRLAEKRAPTFAKITSKAIPPQIARSLSADTKPLSPQSGGSVNLSVGTITPGSTVVLTYQVTVNNTAPSGASTISNQGTVTSNAPTVTTDDPDVGGANDPTVTPLLHPTAANGTVSGRITDTNGNPVEGAVVRLSGSQSRKMITDANGNYQFDNVHTDGFYTVTPSRATFNFNPFNRSFSQIGNKTEAAFTGTSLGDNTNPVDTAEYFVRQQYLDVLGREPEEAGFNYWSDKVLACGSDVHCVNNGRRDIAAAFFISEEYQASGSYIYDVYSGSLGRRPAFAEFSTDRGLVVGGATLDTEKTVFARNFVQRAEFATKYQNAMTAESFVDALIQSVQSSGVDLGGERTNLISSYNQGTDLVTSRAAVLRSVADNAVFKQSQFNPAFVLTEYFAYLRRNIDQNGYDFWVQVLNSNDPGNYRGMVCSFVTSAEYQNRFSLVVTHSNGECAR